MEAKEHEFLRRKFMHLFKCFEHTREGFITKEDAELHSKELESILRRQLESEGVSNDDIERRIAEFDADWVPSAMKYFAEMAKFAANRTIVSADEFMAFNMSIHDYIVQHDALPSWFEDSLRKSYVKCWSNKEHLLVEDGLELLPGESLVRLFLPVISGEVFRSLERCETIRLRIKIVKQYIPTS